VGIRLRRINVDHSEPPDTEEGVAEGGRKRRRRGGFGRTRGRLRGICTLIFSGFFKVSIEEESKEEVLEKWKGLEERG
jgi:hypothetical protein